MAIDKIDWNEWFGLFFSKLSGPRYPPSIIGAWSCTLVLAIENSPATQRKKCYSMKAIISFRFHMHTKQCFFQGSWKMLTFLYFCHPSYTTLSGWWSCPYTCKRKRPLRRYPKLCQGKGHRTQWPCSRQRKTRCPQESSAFFVQSRLHNCWWLHVNGSFHRRRDHCQK